MSDHASHTCSAPGKVLLAGGYLVLDRPNIGITIATTSKFHTTTEWDSKKHQKDDNDENATLQSLAITVVSPQFGTTNVYNVLPPGKEDGSTPYVVLTDVTGNETPRNKFVETCLVYAISACVLLGKREHMFGTSDVRITLRADNSFYSQRDELKRRGLPCTSGALRTLEPFRPLQTVAKTGLGSSAALVTSFVGSFLAFMGCAELPSVVSEADRVRTSRDLELVHRLAQAAHVMAQGKVGSGFDVCSACFGSNVYVRCSPDILKPVLEECPAGVEAAEGQTVGPLLHVLERIVVGGQGARAEGDDGASVQWDHGSTPFGLPKHFCMGLGDISAGSSTPSMVRKVKAYLAASKASVEAGETPIDVGAALWNELGELNGSIRTEFEALSTVSGAHPFVYKHTLHVCETVKCTEWGGEGNPSEGIVGWMSDVLGAQVTVDEGTRSLAAPPLSMDERLSVSKGIVHGLCRLRDMFQRARACLKELGDLAKVPIEPEEQTVLCNRTLFELPGVLSVSVPGAGGHDAIVAICIGKESLKQVETFWAETSEFNGKVCMLPLEAGEMYDGLLVSSKQGGGE